MKMASAEFDGPLLIFAAQVLVDAGNLRAPAPPFPVIQIHQLFPRPMEIISQKGHFLIEPVLGIQGQL